MLSTENKKRDDSEVKEQALGGRAYLNPKDQQQAQSKTLQYSRTIVAHNRKVYQMIHIVLNKSMTHLSHLTLLWPVCELKMQTKIQEN